MAKHRASYGTSGFAIGYARDKGDFRVYFCLFLGIVLLAVGGRTNSQIALLPGFLFLLTAYYFYPLIETDKVRLGAGEHGVFIEGLGLIPWHMIATIELSTTAMRTIEVNELNIELSKELPHASIAGWHSRRPWYRLAMKLPWTMGKDNVVRINLEPFAAHPEKILAALKRTQQFFSDRH